MPQLAHGKITLGDTFADHRITGWVPHAAAKGIDPTLDVPLISHVAGGLYQGGCKNGVLLPEGFDFVLSLYQRGRYALPPNCDRREVLMHDALDQGFEQVEELAADVAGRLARGQTVLVHCQAGLNRSGLLSARALMYRGHTAQDAIDLLRTKRSPLVLCNEAFEDWLLSQ
ncbi:MAG: protein-tyrosine phosphatase family protein [Mycobacteriaceae bacterium]